MVVYDARPIRLAQQIVLDLVVVIGIIAAAILGRTISRSISGLASIGTRVHQQGTAFEKQLGSTAKALGKIPFIGNDVSSPMKNASKTAGSIAAAGTQQHDQTIHLAHLVGTGTSTVLILALVIIWVRYRGGFIRHATATRRLDRSPDGTELLAIRALVNRNATKALAPGVVQRWQNRDQTTIQQLAEIERNASGLRRRAPR
jgi:hypothetical protein